MSILFDSKIIAEKYFEENYSELVSSGNSIYLAVSRSHNTAIRVDHPDLAPDNYVFKVSVRGDHKRIELVR